MNKKFKLKGKQLWLYDFKKHNDWLYDFFTGKKLRAYINLEYMYHTGIIERMTWCGACGEEHSGDPCCR